MHRDSRHLVENRKDTYFDDTNRDIMSEQFKKFFFCFSFFELD